MLSRLFGSFSRWAACAALLMAAGAAQAATTVANLAAARALTDGTVVTISGQVVVTAKPGEVANASTLYVSDTSGADGQTGICVYGSAISGATYNRGDVITNLTGTLATYNGIRELTSPAATVSSTGGTIPSPTVLTASTTFADVDGELVKITAPQVTFGSSYWQTGLYSMSPTFGIFTALYVYASSSGLGLYGSGTTAVPAGTFDVVGIAKYYSPDYEILPRGASDIILASSGDDPDYQAASGVSFGPVAKTAMASGGLVITNRGASNVLKITTATTISGAGAGKFSVSSALPFSVAAKSSSTLGLSFNPNGTLGLSTATLNIVNNDQSTKTASVLLSGVAAQELPAYEPFDYAAGKLTTNSNYQWTAYSGKDTKSPSVIDDVVNSTSSLSYEGMSSSGNRLKLGGYNGEDDKFLFAGSVGTGEAIYTSFLLKVTSAPLDKGTTSDNARFFSFNKSTNYSVGGLRIAAGSTANSYVLGLSMSAYANSSIDFGTTELTSGTTYLVVVKYQINSGTSNDVVTAWINPAVGSSTEGAGALMTITHTTGSSESEVTDGSETINGVTFEQQDYAAGWQAEIDEVRIATNYAQAFNTAQVNAASHWQMFE